MFPPHKSIQVFLLTIGRATLKDRRPMGHSSILKSYTFLAPLSEPIFGSEKTPEPKREKNNGIDRFLVLQPYTFLAPLSEPIFRSEKAPETKLQTFKTSVRGAKARTTFRVTYPLDPCNCCTLLKRMCAALRREPHFE